MKSFTYALLASSVLTTVGSASAATLTENPAADLPNSSPGQGIDFGSFQTVQGTLAAGSDPADFFTFTGLTPGATFSITFERLAGCFTCASPFVFTADGFSETLQPPNSKTDTGILSATSLTVGVANNVIGSSTAEGYSVTLTELPAGVPGPPAAAIFAVGLAGLAIARRRRRR